VFLTSLSAQASNGLVGVYRSVTPDPSRQSPDTGEYCAKAASGARICRAPMSDPDLVEVIVQAVGD